MEKRVYDEWRPISRGRLDVIGRWIKTICMVMDLRVVV